MEGNEKQQIEQFVNKLLKSGLKDLEKIKDKWLIAQNKYSGSEYEKIYNEIKNKEKEKSDNIKFSAITGCGTIVTTVLVVALLNMAIPGYVPPAVTVAPIAVGGGVIAGGGVKNMFITADEKAKLTEFATKFHEEYPAQFTNYLNNKPAKKQEKRGLVKKVVSAIPNPFKKPERKL